MERTTISKEYIQKMYQAISNLETEEECAEFFEDLCTPTELSAMAQRYAVASLLAEDKVYLEIMKQTNASSATISRVKRMMTTGTGRLPKMIQKMKEKNQK